MIAAALISTLILWLVRRRNRRQRVTPVEGGRANSSSAPFDIDAGGPALPSREATRLPVINPYWLPQPQTTNVNNVQGHAASFALAGSEYAHLPTFPPSSGPSSLSSLNRSLDTTSGTPNESAFGGLSQSTTTMLLSGHSPSASLATNVGILGTGSAPGSGHLSGHGVDSGGSGNGNGGLGGPTFSRDARLKQLGLLGHSSVSSTNSNRLTPTAQAQMQVDHYSRIGRTSSTLAPGSAHHRASESASDPLSPVRYEQDYGPLTSSTATPDELVMPPEYENARQPWERRIDHS